MSIIELSEPPFQDYIVLAGQKSPGVAVVRGCNDPRKWDVRAGYGITGATLVFMGKELAKFDVDIYGWEDDHFGDWTTFAKSLLMAPAGIRLTSLSIQHPALNDHPHNINQVVVTDCTQWEQVDDGLWMRTISFSEYRKPKPVLVKPYEGPPGSPLVVTPSVDPELQIIKENAAQISALANAQ